MTLAEIEALDTDIITLKQAASAMRSNEQLLRVQMHQRPESIPFPFIVIGRRVKIPRDAFVGWMRGKQ